MLKRLLYLVARVWFRRFPDKFDEMDREHEAWQDALIVQLDYHRMNEDMLLPGDPPYWPDELWGEPHSHLVPLTCLPEGDRENVV